LFGLAATEISKHHNVLSFICYITQQTVKSVLKLLHLCLLCSQFTPKFKH